MPSPGDGGDLRPGSMDDTEKWPEVEKARTEKRRELVLQGPGVDKRIASAGGLTSAVYTLTLLNYLEVSQCPSLTEIHEDVGHLTSLQSLVLCRNRLSSIPDLIGNLRSLRVLDLSVNNLRGLPEGIVQLRELNALNVSCNDLEVLPEGLSQCTKLSTINISKNRITRFPADFCSERLDLLSTLVASDNSIEELSGDVHKLAALKVGRTPPLHLSLPSAVLISCHFDWRPVRINVNMLANRREIFFIKSAQRHAE